LKIKKSTKASLQNASLQRGPASDIFAEWNHFLTTLLGEQVQQLVRGVICHRANQLTVAMDARAVIWPEPRFDPRAKRGIEDLNNFNSIHLPNGRN